MESNSQGQGESQSDKVIRINSGDEPFNQFAERAIRDQIKVLQDAGYTVIPEGDAMKKVMGDGDSSEQE